MANEPANTEGIEGPEFGATVFFCVELFCGTGNLTYVMKHFFPDSFGWSTKRVNDERRSFAWI